MPLNEKAVHLTLHISRTEDADAETLDHHTRQLQAEIRELGVESVSSVRREGLPEGAKAGEVVTLGALAVAILPEVLPTLIECIQAWLIRGERSEKIKIEIGDQSVEITTVQDKKSE